MTVVTLQHKNFYSVDSTEPKMLELPSNLFEVVKISICILMCVCCILIKITYLLT